MAELQKANRLIFLYFLGIEIPEPYHRVISRLCEFLDFDDSKDLVKYKSINHIEKCNKKGEYVCIYRSGIFTMDFRTNSFVGFLDNERRCLNNNFAHFTNKQLLDYMKPFIFCILERRGISLDDIIY